MDESASIICARVVRGISSTAKEMTPARAMSSIVSREPSDRRNPIKTCSRRYKGMSAFPVLSFEPAAEYLGHDIRGAKDFGAVLQKFRALGCEVGAGIPGFEAIRNNQSEKFAERSPTFLSRVPNFPVRILLLKRVVNLAVCTGPAQYRFRDMSREILATLGPKPRLIN